MPEARQTYTDQQRAALETLKAYRPDDFGAARPEFINHVLDPQGNVNSDVGAVVAKADAEVGRILSIEPKTPDVLREATRAAERAAELRDHIEQNRFLFVLGDDGLPLIYFQCAVAHNRDVYPLTGTPAEG
jgi:hypothetical protein